MAYTMIQLEKTEGIAALTLHRPAAMNALCRVLNEELLAAFAQLAQEPDTRVLVITGGPKAFAAGADIAEMAEATPEEALQTAELGHRVHDMLEALPFPTIAAVCGPAMGGGCELSLACDFRVVGENALFALPEVGLGILPGAGGTQRLLPLVGVALAREMVLLGRRLNGAEAQAAGLANVCVPDDQVTGAALDMAQKLCKKPAKALRFAKQAINTGIRNTLEVGCAAEREQFVKAFSTNDQKEGMRAFMEKRKPVYTHS